MPADTLTPLNLDDRVPCAFCGGEFRWSVLPGDDDSKPHAFAECADCGVEWSGHNAPVTWRTLATSGEEVPVAYVARLVGEVERLTAERGARPGDDRSDRDIQDPTVAICEAARVDPYCDDPAAMLRARIAEENNAFRVLRKERDVALARVAELEATLANERGEGEPPCAGYMSVCEAERPDEDNPDDDIVVRWRGAWDGECDVYVGTSGEDHLWWWSVMGRTSDDRLVMLAHGRAPTARAAMIAADAARSAGGGGS